MSRSSLKALSLWLAAVAACLLSSPAGAEPIAYQMVTVGNPGNANDTTGYGTVAEAFQIMKFEFTNSQYAAFLNAIDPAGTNPDGVYNGNMGSNARGGITNTGTTNGSRYAVKSNMGDKPVNYVSWFDAARVSNWLHNGAQTYVSTDSSAIAPQNTGAYTVGTATSGNAVAVNSGALFYVPTENEWYKAAFYNPTLNGGSGGYRVYGNGFDDTPGIVSADNFGVGSAGGTGNFANYNNGADWNGQDGNVTTVGTNGGASFYGAFDMSGNVLEWNDLTGAADSSRGVRGGRWNVNANSSSSSWRSTFSASNDSNSTGFRLASPFIAPVPEIDPAGMGSVLALVTGALGLLERRRLKAS
jgi:formylglycine-generating enzyme